MLRLALPPGSNVRRVAPPAINENTDAFDSWSQVHLVMGIAARAMGLPIVAYIPAAIGWDAMEYALEHPDGHPMFGTRGPESVENITADLVLGTIGYLVASSIA